MPHAPYAPAAALHRYAPAAAILIRYARAVSWLSRRAGETAAWLYPLLMLVLIVNVALRYGLGRGFIELEELQWHLFSAGFLLCFAYAMAQDEHVRVDLFSRRISKHGRAWVELLGTLLLLLPFLAIADLAAFEYFQRAWSIGERSAMSSGLPARWAIKFVLFAGLLLLSLQATAVAARAAAVLLGAAPEEEAHGNEKENAGEAKSGQPDFAAKAEADSRRDPKRAGRRVSGPWS